MNDSTMLYKCPGPHQIHSGNFDYQIVPDIDVTHALTEGWYLTTQAAKEAYDAEQQAARRENEPQKEPDLDKVMQRTPVEDDNAPPTRAELEAKAKELGISVHHRSSDAKIAAAIDQALAAKE